ncbi:hypothetical protein O6H91_06G048200 [Diphasiastrum complanatum]|uniref:Uncharacterized protein n=4 Tax=Diphasiastrum complanatum TaxID=34168 RepID=A0ACC2DE78_DIPCM|nr:hypothetical protein O6H91_06G048200 [Diphasiastrum complanatum]KAJ7552274.1 hypothetical protein O6H91_06G048200 [Diphasiastrum complanatum]KAJ7552280.1 hypothetical protein O6H91_06G048200 [Diphasiastrum complanatum]KAJ7552281.1 hypothetical protein O6H91_06G048200 [Diphasiastrum complanatum]
MAVGGSRELLKLEVLVAQLESLVVLAAQQPPDPLICFDLLSDLLSTLKEDSKEAILRCQRKCENSLQSLIFLGVRPPVRRLAAAALVQLFEKGDTISIYSRASSLQGWLLDSKKVETSSLIGAAQLLGALYRFYGQKLNSGLSETSSIVTKLMKLPELAARHAALQLLQAAIEGSGGGGTQPAYSEALRVITRLGATDKSPTIRAAAACCLRALAESGGPGLVAGVLETCALLCVKALEDPAQPVRDSFAAALGALLAIDLNPQLQVLSKNKEPVSLTAKTLEGGLKKHLIVPFIRASGPRVRDVRFGLTMAWVAFLQRVHVTHSDFELAEFAMQALSMLASSFKGSIDTHAQACVMYILRVGIVEQMGEPAQKDLIDLLTKQLSSADNSPSMLVVVLRTLSHLLTILGEVSLASREALDNSLVEMLSHSSTSVRVEAAMTLQGLAEVDPTCANSVMSCGVTTLWALRETVAVERGDRLRVELDSLHGQAAMLAALLATSPKLLLGLPTRLPAAILDVGKKMVLQPVRNPVSATVEKEAGWMLIGSYISSVSREELEEQELDILALWTVPFGGNRDEALKKAEGQLSSEVSGWSAAMEALTAFIEYYVNPNSSVKNEGILVQPILGYLSGALAYISSPILQQASPGMKPAADIFTLKALQAYRALRDPLLYKADHTFLLTFCCAIFRDASIYGESSCLRQLLDFRDASLGPWVPGRDSFEDELRAFEGGSDGNVPCVWDNNSPIFPQPLPVATMLIDEMLICVGNIFAALSENSKLQLLDLMEASHKAGRKQNWHAANTTNICVALLAGLKASLGGKNQDSEGEVSKRIQALCQGILAEEVSSPGHRRAAAEVLGLLARFGSDVYAARLMRLLLSDASGATDAVQKASIALAIGCIHRSVGGMALSVLVPATVQTLCATSRDPRDILHIWSLHGLWLTIEAAGLSYVPHVQMTLSLVMDVLLSEEHSGPELRQCIGRVVNATVAVLGPELLPGSSFFSRCKSVVSELSAWEEPATLLECVLYTQQLVLFAPQAMPVRAHVQTLRSTLASKQPSLRQAAVATLRHLSERDPGAMVDERVEEDLFSMLDSETDSRIVNSIQLALERLLEAACPFFSSRWLQLCRNVVLASTTKKSIGRSFEVLTEGGPDIKDGEIFSAGDDESMMISISTVVQSGAKKRDYEIGDNKSKHTDHLPRYRTRVFAAECLSRLPTAVGVDPAHFDLVRAKEQQIENGVTSCDWLVLHLGELVALAYQVGTGQMESIRPLGIYLLDTTLEKFGKTEDPEYGGHLLLEQYLAQFISAIRTALEPSSSPLLMDAGVRLAARVVISGVSGGDHGVIQRIVSMISQPLSKWENLKYPSYAEWVGCKVQAGLLWAHAQVKTYALAESSVNAGVGLIINPILRQHSSMLHHCWIGLLKDYTMLRTQLASKLQAWYTPFLEGLQSAAVASKVQSLLQNVCPTILEAVTVDAVPTRKSNDDTLSSDDPLTTERVESSEADELKVENFLQIWLLAMLILADEDPRAVKSSRQTHSFHSFLGKSLEKDLGRSSEYLQTSALKSLRYLCQKPVYTMEMLSTDLCKELLQVLISGNITGYSWAPAAILGILQQIVTLVPENYLLDEELVLLVIEICMFYIHQLSESDAAVSKASISFGVAAITSSALVVVENLVARLNIKMKSILLPEMLYSGIKIINLRSVSGNLALSCLTLITALSTLPLESTTETVTSPDKEPFQRDLVKLLSAAVESLARILETYCAENNNRNGEFPTAEATQHMSLLLGVMVAIARSIPDVKATEWERYLRESAQRRCISCLHNALSSGNPQVQLVVLQTLRTVVQSGLVEQPDGGNRDWALLLMLELSAEVTSVVFNTLKANMTIAAAGVIGESLKLLILLHSLVKNEQSQLEVLHVLLTIIIASASIDPSNNLQASTVLSAVAVKLVTHLASVQTTSGQVKAVLSELPEESRQRLQDIIRASVPMQTSQTTSQTSVPAASSASKLSAPTGNILPPPPSRPLSSNQNYPSEVSSSVHNISDESEEDWDDFQEHSFSNTIEFQSEPGNTVIQLDDPKADSKENYRGSDAETFETTVVSPTSASQAAGMAEEVANGEETEVKISEFDASASE